MVTIGFRIAPRAVEISHLFIRQVVASGDIVVDATAGNGYDTLFLSQLVGEEGMVIAFDIQEEALRETRIRLEEAGMVHRVKLYQTGHENMDRFISTPVKAVVFNLGFLPGGEAGLVTLPATTVKALEKSLDLLLPGGLICLVVYWGHPGGKEEKQAVEEFVSRLSQDVWDVTEILFPNRFQAPCIVVVQKK